MSKLSLTTRKNIKDAEPKLQANLKKITAASGITFDLEIDWMALAPVAEERGYKDRVGEIVYDWYLGGLADNITSFCKDPIQKESFVEAFGTAKRITFVIVELGEDEESFYVKTKNDSGSLVMMSVKDRFCSNVSNAGNDLSKTCSGDSGPMTVATRKNIKDQEATRKKHLTRIQKAAGIEFEVDIDWVTFAVAAKDRGYEDRVGEIIYNWYLDGLAGNVESFIKDPIQKESFTETFGERKTIAFHYVESMEDDDPHRSDYVWVSNKEGVLTINIPKDRFVSNTSNTGNDLSKACSGDSPMSVAARKNIADNGKKLATALKTIKTACGIDFELDVDWVKCSVVAKERGYEDRAGDIIYDWYMGGLADNITSFCKDAIQKESFTEAFGERKNIAFVIHESMDEEDPHRSDYVWVRNEGGVLQVNIPKERFCSNVSNTGNDLSKACSGDGPMSVATRKNIKDQEPTRKKHLTRIQKATGLDFEVEVDWAVFAVAAKERGYEDRVGEIIYSWYLDGLAGNLESLCKDEMCKEAVAEAAHKKVISFQIVPQEELESAYVRCTFGDDGTLIVSVSTERFVSNTSNTGNDIESRL